MFFTCERLLEPTTLEKVRQLLAQARFGDGSATANVGRKAKYNLEMQVGEPYLKLVELLDQALDASDVVANRVFPRYRVAPIINRFDAGMHYGLHVDAPIQGGRTQLGRSPGRFGQNFVRTDYSMTLFLSPPESYDGGELELQVGERRELVKLPAGSAVCYQTGIPHAVREVTRGSRVCAIYWFQSLIRDMSLRRTLWDLTCLQRKLAQSGDTERAGEAESIRSNFIRYLADV